MTSFTSQAIANYTANFQQRQIRDLLRRKQRYQQGWEQAKIAAKILKTRFGVGQVLVFGSLLNSETFDVNSDIDLAVEKLPLNQYCDAVGMLLLKVKDFNVDLVRLEAAQPDLKAHILQEGVKL
jgi:predicted nucleotidyltransferase